MLQFPIKNLFQGAQELRLKVGARSTICQETKESLNLLLCDRFLPIRQKGAQELGFKIKCETNHVPTNQEKKILKPSPPVPPRPDCEVLLLHDMRWRQRKDRNRGILLSTFCKLVCDKALLPTLASRCPEWRSKFRSCQHERLATPTLSTVR